MLLRFNAISHQTKGRVAAAMPDSGQQEHCANTGEEGHTEVCEQIQGNLSEQYGRRPERSPGTILLPRRGQNICLPSIGDDTGHTITLSPPPPPGKKTAACGQ